MEKRKYTKTHDRRYYKRQKKKLEASKNSSKRKDGLPAITMHGTPRVEGDGRAGNGGHYNRGGYIAALNRRFSALLADALERRDEDEGGERTNYQVMLDDLVHQACGGNLTAKAMIMDRILGRAPQKIDINQKTKTANLNITREMSAQEAQDAYMAMLREAREQKEEDDE